MTNHLWNWIRTHKFDVCTDHPPTHVFLNGGKALIPEDNLTEFYEAYAKDIQRGTPLFVVERTNMSYRMFADFDINLSTTSLPTVNVITLVEYALSKFPFPSRSGNEVTVCVRNVHKGKTGAHLVWTDLRVNDEQARELRHAWLNALEDPAWKDTIDEAVYRRNGLRMPWSQKPSDAGSMSAVYTPSHLWSEHSRQLVPWHVSIDAPIEQLKDALRRCSIEARSNPPPQRALSPLLASLALGTVTHDTRPSTTHDAPSVLLAAARKCCPDEQPQFKVHVFVPKRLYSFTCLPLCRECKIADRQHRSNHIYFNLGWEAERQQWKLVQKCHSGKCQGSEHFIAFINPQGTAYVKPDGHGRKAISSAAERWCKRL